jgi:hypothetical protein
MDLYVIIAAYTSTHRNVSLILKSITDIEIIPIRALRTEECYPFTFTTLASHLILLVG